MRVYKKQADAILVLGTDRSGTSMTSNLVQRWARYNGDPCISPIIDPSNPKGYFESPEVELTLAEAILYLIESKGISSWSPSFNEHLLSIVVDKKEFASDLEHQFKSLRDVGVPWCSKTPLLSVTVALWEHFVSDPVLVITVRNPYDTAKSLLEFENKKVRSKDIVLGLLRWQHYLIRIIKDTAKFERRFFICYEEVIEDPVLQITKLGEFLGHQYPNNPNQDSAIKEMFGIVEPSLHRNNSSLSFEERDEATQTQKELYALLQKMAKEQTMPTSIDFDKYLLTEQEIKVLEKNKLEVLPDITRPKILKKIWGICKYMVNKYKADKE
jgi:hypothetical protein